MKRVRGSRKKVDWSRFLMDNSTKSQATLTPESLREALAVISRGHFVVGAHVIEPHMVRLHKSGIPAPCVMCGRFAVGECIAPCLCPKGRTHHRELSKRRTK